MPGERHEHHSPCAWCDLFQRLKPLPRECHLEMRKTCYICARSRNARYHAEIDRIGYLDEYDGRAACCLLQLQRRHWATHQDYVRRVTKEFGDIGPDML